MSPVHSDSITAEEAQQILAWERQVARKKGPAASEPELALMRKLHRIAYPPRSFVETDTDLTIEVLGTLPLDDPSIQITEPGDGYIGSLDEDGMKTLLCFIIDALNLGDRE